MTQKEDKENLNIKVKPTQTKASTAEAFFKEIAE